MGKAQGMFRVAAQSALFQRGRLIIYVLDDFIMPVISVLLWIGIYRYSGSIAAGWSLEYLISYYLLVTFFGLALNHYVESTLQRHINEGEIANYLIKPMSYRRYVFWTEGGWKVVRMLASLLPLAIFGFLFRPYITLSPSFIQIILTFLFSILAYMLIFFYKLILGFTAFWSPENEGVIHFFWALGALFGGRLIPFDFLPDILQRLSFVLPFRFFYYLPAMTILEKRPLQTWLPDILVGTFWLMGFWFMSGVLLRRGLRLFSDTRS